MFRILSLDGGGIKGAFAASVLAELEQVTGQSAVDHFDLVTGTSTGELISLGRGEAVKKANLDAVKARFLNGTPAVPFVPMVPLAP
ncbi:patatin-like phospholipase family protein [uncultured Thiodictyon sp.]|uniref:patatin-like phospholipase family protein n=1 Tax=uncultured Thiodictyon sp. TaxID=1846217 RepID=UPI0025EC9E79|nr:patatin-like phospholipase family protein [uncultured Thiodictyon sp.]